MAILNLEELKKQIKEGTFRGLESLENEFKSMLKEGLQETAKERQNQKVPFPLWIQHLNFYIYQFRRFKINGKVLR